MSTNLQPLSPELEATASAILSSEGDEFLSSLTMEDKDVLFSAFLASMKKPKVKKEKAKKKLVTCSYNSLYVGEAFLGSSLMKGKENEVFIKVTNAWAREVVRDEEGKPSLGDYKAMSPEFEVERKPLC